MNEKLPVVTVGDVQLFLESFVNGKVVDLHSLSGGKHSEAFSYTHDRVAHVIRFNTSNRGFLKDVYAYEHFSNDVVVMPKIYEVGKYNECIFYCISEKIEGETPKEQYKRGDFSSLKSQFEMIEQIAALDIPKEYTGFDEFEMGKETRFATFADYLKSMYISNDIVDWNELRLLSYFDQEFLQYLISKIEELVAYSGNAREVTHGDFGNDNLFIQDGKISGVIDWERTRAGDHFLDVGRVVLFCPDREATVQAALDFYKDMEHEHYKERIALGVYVAMLRNYGAALSEGKENSCRNYPNTIKHFEEVFEKYSSKI